MIAALTMADSAYLPEFVIQGAAISDSPKHSLAVRLTHWIHTLSFFGLLVSGIAILLAHPRLYWGETGSVETPSLIDLPLPFMLVGQNGWGRYLHFLSAWMCVLNGVVYVLTGVLARHFGRDLLPVKSELTWRAFAQAVSSHLRFKRAGEQESRRYNVLQRITYLSVVFILFPLVIWTGLAMSPAITSVIPVLVTMLGGHQSARTLHFIVSSLLIVFLLVHIVMVSLAGFRDRVWAMIGGGRDSGRGYA
jgi:thiosulfate reductase cytochrome b subunit